MLLFFATVYSGTANGSAHPAIQRQCRNALELAGVVGSRQTLISSGRRAVNSRFQVEPVVWNTFSGQLIGHINSHGMHDRCEHGWQGQFKPLPADAVHPERRYEGFHGLLRVALEDGADWLVAVLAPLH